MNVFALILFLDQSGAIVAYNAGLAPSIDACHALIVHEEAKPDFNPNKLTPVSYCVKTNPPGVIPGKSVQI